MTARISCCWAWAAALLLPGILWGADKAGPREIDSEKSVMTVHVLKSGVFSAFGHEHQISAPIQQGKFSESDSSVELTVDARKMRVEDKDVSEKDRAEIQETMFGPKVLDTAQFPEIQFRSTAVESTGEGKFAVKGDLTLHGQTRPISFEVQARNGRYQGTAELKQKDFGITPITVGGGAVKVKNELRVEFDIAENRPRIDQRGRPRCSVIPGGCSVPVRLTRAKGFLR
jgi:polyisoprenoid-binding protein YceI